MIFEHGAVRGPSGDSHADVFRGRPCDYSRIMQPAASLKTVRLAASFGLLLTCLCSCDSATDAGSDFPAQELLIVAGERTLQPAKRWPGDFACSIAPRCERLSLHPMAGTSRFGDQCG